VGTLINAAAVGARSPIPYTSMRGGNWYGTQQTRFGKTGQLTAMGASAALYSVVNRTSTAVAAEVWHLHRPMRGGTCDFEQPDGEKCGAVGVAYVPRHPAQVIIDRPNDFYTTSELFESGQQHHDLTGEGWLVVGRIGTMPAELWVARPDRMVVVTDPDKFLTGYIYLGPDGREVPIKRQDVLSIRTPSPLDAYRGMGAVQTIMQQVTGAQFSAEWNTNFFRNGARPGGIVKLSRDMNDTDFNRLVDRFNAAHRGAANAGRTAFLEEGDWVDVKPMSLADMQFVETANLNRDTILLAFGMSKFAVGVVDDVNRATAEASKTWFGETQTVPRLKRWKDMFNNDFLPLFPGWSSDPSNAAHVTAVHSNPIPADRETARDDRDAAVKNFVLLVRAGVDPAEAATVCGLPEMTIVSEPLSRTATVIPADG
jgi:HK97 family phage portal protein